MEKELEYTPFKELTDEERDEKYNIALSNISTNIAEEDLECYDIYDNITISALWFGYNDLDGTKYIISKTQEGLIITCEEKNHRYRVGQSIEKNTEKRIECTEYNLNLFRLLCKYIYESAMYDIKEKPKKYYDYSLERVIRLHSSDHEVLSEIITFEMLAVLSKWIDISKFLALAWDYCDCNRLKNPHIKAVNKDVTKDKEHCYYLFSYFSGNETQTFKFEGLEWGVKTSIIRKSGEVTEIKSKEEYGNKFGDFYKLIRLFTKWTIKNVTKSNDDYCSFSASLVSCNKDDSSNEVNYSFSKIDKRLLDLINFFAPEQINVPEAFIIDNNNSVFFRMNKKIPDYAFENNKYIRYLRIEALYDDENNYSPEEQKLFEEGPILLEEQSHYEEYIQEHGRMLETNSEYSIGINAFKNSSLAVVEAEPRFYASYGTGVMPYVKEGAFDGCNLTGITFDGVNTYFSNFPLGVYRLELWTTQQR